MEQRAQTLTAEQSVRRDVFLSYALADGKIARTLCEKLEAVGISVWYATRDLYPGPFSENIRAAIQQCKAFVVVFSEIGMRSEELLSELDAALKRKFVRHENIVIIPVLVDMESLSEPLRYYLDQMNCFDARRQPLEKRLDELVQQIQKALTQRQMSSRQTARMERRPT